MNVEEQMVADAENYLIQEFQLLDVEPHAITHDLIGISENRIISNVNYRVPVARKAFDEITQRHLW